MVSIKNSVADCMTCKLLDAPSCIMDTNTKSDLSKVDVIFIAENPGKEEVKQGIPLVGKAGKHLENILISISKVIVNGY